MNELNKRLDKIEQQINIIASHHSPVFGNPISSRSDEIDLRELFVILWQGKWWIFGITFLFAVAGIFYALSLPNMYKSEGIYAPAQKDNGAGGMAGQLGGLAAFAGISFGASETSDIDQALTLLRSWEFIVGVINRNNMKPVIMAAKDYDINSDAIIWDAEIYDPELNEWTRKPSPGKPKVPKDYEVYKQFMEFYSVSQDAKTGLVTINIEFFSPSLAQQWIAFFVDAINQHFQKRDILESKNSIAYLEEKISQTSLAEMQSVFYGMIEAQMKTLMLAEVGDEYLLKTVVSPTLPEQKSSPRRGLICMVFVCLGGFLALLIVLFKRKDNA